jgi:hypothetical protein
VAWGGTTVVIVVIFEGLMRMARATECVVFCAVATLWAGNVLPHQDVLPLVRMCMLPFVNAVLWPTPTAGRTKQRMVPKMSPVILN